MYLDLEIVIGNALLLIDRAMQTSEAPIMRVCTQRSLLGQAQPLLDVRDQVLPSKDAPVRKEGEFLALHVAHHSAASIFFVLGLRRSLANLPPLLPHVDVASGEVKMVAVLLTLTQRSTVDEQLAIGRFSPRTIPASEALSEPTHFRRVLVV